MPYAIVNNIRMHFEVSGKGDPVLLINGLSAPAAAGRSRRRRWRRTSPW